MNIIMYMYIYIFIYCNIVYIMYKSIAQGRVRVTPDTRATINIKDLRSKQKMRRKSRREKKNEKKKNNTSSRIFKCKSFVKMPAHTAVH